MKNIATPQYYYVLKHYLIITKKKRTFNIYIYIERERERLQDTTASRFCQRATFMAIGGRSATPQGKKK
jgi:hypothetical protein